MMTMLLQRVRSWVGALVFGSCSLAAILFFVIVDARAFEASQAGD